MPEVQKIQWRRGTAAAWTAANPVLSEGTPGFESDTGKFKVGDGVKDWKTLAYQGDVAGGVAAGAVTTTVVDADVFPVSSAGVLKKLSWANFKAVFKAWWSVETATLSNKSLVSPKIDVIADTGGSNTVRIEQLSNAANHLWFKASNAGNSPILGVEGTDPNIGIFLYPKGAGGLSVSCGSTTTSTIGAAGNKGGPVDLKLASQGLGNVNLATNSPGQVTANGIPVVTTTAAQALSQKTIRGSVNTVLMDGAVPASKTAAGQPGQVAVAAGFVYVCVAANTWQRAPLADW